MVGNTAQGPERRELLPERKEWEQGGDREEKNKKTYTPAAKLHFITNISILQ